MEFFDLNSVDKLFDMKDNFTRNSNCKEGNMGVIRVTGTGRTSVAPDTIEISLNVKESDGKEQKALQKADDRVVALKQEIKKLGIDEKRVVTKNFSISQYNKLYNVSYSIVLSIDYDTKLLGKALSCLSESLNHTDVRVNFSLKNQEGIKEKVITDAVANAKEDAQILANASGVKLGNVLSISHSFNMLRINRGYSNTECLSMAKASVSVESFDDMNVDEINFEAHVNMEWEIK